MLKVQCYSGYKVNERPVAFTLLDRSYNVEEIVDRWYGERVVYFKVRANDQNIYLLKYDEHKDGWDLVFYENPGRLKTVHAFEGADASLVKPPGRLGPRIPPSRLN